MVYWEYLPILTKTHMSDQGDLHEADATIDRKKIIAIRDFIVSAERSIQSAKKMLSSMTGTEDRYDPAYDTSSLTSYRSDDDKIVEGVFTGESMLGSDQSIYPVPQNYASKSHLVQGSKLKATIKSDGRIIYKIIEEIEYETKIGLVTKNRDKYQIISDGKVYNVLLASITFIKAEVGDSVSIRLPKGKEATFATVVAVIPKA